MDWLKGDIEYYIYAEYNPFFIYGGWHLYAISVENINKDSRISQVDYLKEWRQQTWLHYDWRLDALMESIGSPKFGFDHHAACISFMKKCPAGIVCKIEDDGRKYIIQQSDDIGDYLRRVRQRQLDLIAKAQEKTEEEAK